MAAPAEGRGGYGRPPAGRGMGGGAWLLQPKEGVGTVDPQRGEGWVEGHGCSSRRKGWVRSTPSGERDGWRGMAAPAEGRGGYGRPPAGRGMGGGAWLLQ